MARGGVTLVHRSEIQDIVDGILRDTNGTARVSATTSGADVTGNLDITGNLDTGGRIQVTQADDNGLQLVRGAQTWNIYTEDADSTLRLRDATNSEDGLVIAPNSFLQLNFNGSPKVRTQEGGIYISRSGAPFIGWYSDETYTTRVGYLQYNNGSLGIKMKSEVDGSIVRILADDAGGTERTILDADPDAKTTLRADSNLELQVAAGETALLATANGNVALYQNNVEVVKTRNHASNYNTSSLQIKDHGGTYYDVGWNVVPVIERDANHTMTETDVGHLIHRDTTGTVTYTLPSGTSGAVPPVGSLIMIANENTGTCTISAAGTLRWFQGSGGAAPLTGNRTLARDAICSVYHYANAEWWIWGNGIS